MPGPPDPGKDEVTARRATGRSGGGVKRWKALVGDRGALGVGSLRACVRVEGIEAADAWLGLGVASRVWEVVFGREFPARTSTGNSTPTCPAVIGSTTCAASVGTAVTISIAGAVERFIVSGGVSDPDSGGGVYSGGLALLPLAGSRVMC